MSSLFELEEEFTYVIDSNDKIRERLEALELEMQNKAAMKEQELRDRVQTFFDELEYDEEGKPVIPVDEEGYYLVPMDDEGNPLVNIDEEGNILMDSGDTDEEGESFDSEEGDYPEGGESRMSPDEIIEAANIQAEAIIADANEQAEAIKSVAADEGEKQGYTDGLAKGAAEYEDKQRELEAERDRILNELSIEKQNMEKDVVDIVCDVVERAFGVLFGDSKELILHLVDNTLLNIDSSKTFLIRVSENDHAFLTENKESLLSRLGTDVILDIVMDPLMADGSCMIETDGGVFNCGIDKQMEGLMRDIRLLSAQ